VQSLTWPLDSVNGQLHIPASLTRGSTPVPTECVTFWGSRTGVDDL